MSKKKNPWNKGKKLSEKTKRKISIKLKGKIPWNKDKPWPPEVRDKISKANRGKLKGIKKSKEHVEKIARALRNRTFSETHRQRLSEAQKLVVKARWDSEWGHNKKKEFKIRFSGRNNPMYGRKRNDLAERNKSSVKRGKEHWHWRGGVSRNEHWGYKAVQWREAVFKKDNYTCQACGKRGGDIEADHIKSWFIYPKLRYELENGRTLCKACHKKTENWGAKGWRELLS